MAAGVKLATAYVQIVASAAGVRKDVAKELNLVAGDATKVGVTSGKKMSDGLTKGADAKGFRKRLFSGVDKDAAGVGKRAGGRFKSGMSSALKGFGAGLFVGVGTDQLVGLFKDATKNASDLEQSVGGVQAVFKDFAPQIEKASKEAAQNLGLTKNEYNELATTLGAGLKNKGIKDFGKQTQNLIGIGSDLSAQFGGSTQEAVDALASAMRGEMDPIEKYGISLNQTAIEAEAVSSGLVKNVKDVGKIKAAQNNATIAQRDYNDAVKKYGKGSKQAMQAESRMIRTQAALSKAMDGKVEKLTDEHKAQAALSLINKQSADAQGAFAREADTAAGKQARLRASWENLKTTLGEKLLPVVSSVTGAANNFFVEMEKGTGVGGRFKSVVTGISSAVGATVGFLSKYRTQVAALAIVIGTAVIAQKAYAVSTALATMWTNRQAIATRMLNTVMALNPIGLVVAALVALGVGMVIAYKKSETFRRIVDAAWAGIKKAAAATVAWFKSTAWPVLKQIFSAIGAAAKWLWTNAIGPAFRGIGAVISWWYKNIVKRYFAAVGVILRAAGRVAMWLWRNAFAPAFRGIGAVASWLWSKALKPVFGRIMTGAKITFGWIKNTGGPWVRNAFQAIGDKAKWLWEKGVKTPLDRMKAGFRALTDAAVGMKDSLVKQFERVRDGIQKPLRAVMTFIDKKFISKVKGMLHGVGLESLSVKIPYLTPGGKGYATGGYTGPGGKYQPAGIVHADEFVLRKESVNKLRKTVGLSGLDYMNRTGEMPGYAKGGLVYQSMSSWLKKNIPNAAITSSYRPGSITSSGNLSYHAQGKALDLTPSMDIFNKIKSAFGSSIAELIYSPAGSRQVKNGQNFYYGEPVRGDHWDHVHWAMQSMSGGKGGSILGGFLSGFAGKVAEGGKKVLTDILDKIPGGDGFWGKVAIAPMRMVAGGVFDQFKKAAEMMSAPDSDGGSAPGGGVERWRPMVLRALGIMGLSNKYANSTLRRMMQESGGNPRSVNNWDINARRGDPSKGLMQVIGSTFRSFAHPDYNRDIFDPLSNILASMRYAIHTYGSLFAAYDRKGGYSGGGLVRPAVFDNGGTLAPGLNLVHNKLGKPEPLVRPEHALAGPVVVNVIDRDGTFIDRMRGEIDMARAHDDRLAVR